MPEDESGSKPVACLVEVQVKLIQSHLLSHEVTLATGDKTPFVVVVPLLLERDRSLHMNAAAEPLGHPKIFPVWELQPLNGWGHQQHVTLSFRNSSPSFSHLRSCN